jgi:TPR repeat protein
MRIIALFCLLMAAALHADSLEEGLAAYDAGNFHEAYTRLLPLAQAGNARAQYRVGKMFERGKGIARDEAEAARWYTQAAGQGDADGQCALGGLHEFGMGVARNREKAAELYRLAAAQGHEEAARNLRELEKRGLVKVAAPPPAGPAGMAVPIGDSVPTPAIPAVPDASASEFAYAVPADEAAALATYAAQPTDENLRRVSDLRFKHATQKIDAYFKNGDQSALEEGVLYAEELVENDPGHVRTHLLLGGLAYLSALEGQPTAALAEEHLETALALDPGQPQPQVRLMLARLALQQGWYNRALDYYEPLLRKQPELATEEHVVLMTAAYLADEQAGRGADFFRTLAVIYPERTHLKLGHAAVLAGSGRVKDASRVFQEIIRNPGTPDALRQLAEIQLASLGRKGVKP